MTKFEGFFSCDTVNISNTSTVQISIEDLHIHCYRILSVFYGAALILGAILSALVYACCLRRKRYRRKLDLQRHRNRKHKGRQQVQLMLFSRRLSFDDISGGGNDEFMIRHSVLHSSDFDNDATLERDIQPSSMFQQGLLFSAGSKDNLLSVGSSTDKHPDNCTHVSTTLINKSSDNLTQITANITNKTTGKCQKAKIRETTGKCQKAKIRETTGECHANIKNLSTEEFQVNIKNETVETCKYAKVIDCRNNNLKETSSTMTQNRTPVLPPVLSPVSNLKNNQLNNDMSDVEPNHNDITKCGNKYSPCVLNDRKVKTMQPTKVLQIITDDESRVHSFVEFTPNSPVKIDGKIWKTKSNE